MKINEVDLNTYIEIDDIKIIQRELYSLFFEFHKICEKHDLIYNMYGGTLLGAVRHEGIIPWDDDIDVSMPRDDYEKFKEIVKNQYKDEFVIFSYPQNNYPYPFMKFGDPNSLLLEALRDKYNKLTLYVDVFPIDGCSDDPKERAKVFTKLKRLKHKRVVCVNPINKQSTVRGKIKNILKHCRHALYNVPGYFGYLKREVEISKKYDFNKSKYVCCMASSWFEKGVITREEYSDRILYKFGEHEFWGMRDYDRHLTNLYGDYMQPPPIEERVAKHGYHLYFKKESVTEENNG